MGLFNFIVMSASITFPFFDKHQGEVVKDRSTIEGIINEWAALIHQQYQKGLIPLFVTGSGASIGAGVPDITSIISELNQLYENESLVYKKPSDITELFKLWAEGKRERTIIAKILNAFQSRDELTEAWNQFNTKLLEKIILANQTSFHKILSSLYEDVNAINLTLNFDGLLIRELVVNQHKKAFSLPSKSECESFFTRIRKTTDGRYSKNKEDKEYIEIQVRGDILYLECRNKAYCPQKGRKQPLWATVLTKDGKPDIPKLMKCPSCNEVRESYLSFPGSYEKERDMREMLEVVWKYLSLKVGTITVVGLSGEWDPIIVAFLGDLLSERETRLLVIDKFTKKTEDKEYKYLIRELVKPKVHATIALEMDADKFMEGLTARIKEISALPKSPDSRNPFSLSRSLKDQYWDSDRMVQDMGDFEKSINSPVSRLESALCDMLQDSDKAFCLNKFAQLGLKSQWLGITSKNEAGKYHNRLNHSIGVMKIASYIYENAVKNSGMKINQNEKQFLRLAALLHDIGHLPFSHLIEEIFGDLNWRPAQYRRSFSHISHTEKKIDDLVGDVPELKAWLDSVPYSVSDLKRLINGNFGVPYLDAIINSPIDADKIDYVFRDTDSTNRRITLSPFQFLKDIVFSITITPEGFLGYSGRSAKAASELLLMRRFLYHNLYYQPGIRVLEGLAKLVMTTYFVYNLRFDKTDLLNKDAPDLGQYKTSFCIRIIETLLRQGEVYESANVELAMLSKMVDELKRLPLNNNLRESLELGLKKISEIEREDKLKELEADVKHYHYDKEHARQNYNRMVKVARDCMLRMPGMLLIDVVKERRFLSASEEREKRRRNDGTETFSEVILVPAGKYTRWHAKQDAREPLQSSSLASEDEFEFTVYLYSLWEETKRSDVALTENLFERLQQTEYIDLETD